MRKMEILAVILHSDNAEPFITNDQLQYIKGVWYRVVNGDVFFVHKYTRWFKTYYEVRKYIGVYRSCECSYEVSPEFSQEYHAIIFLTNLDQKVEVTTLSTS